MSPENVSVCLAALAQPTRLAIFRRLVQAGPAGCCPSDLQQVQSLTPSVLSFHLKELRHAKLVHARRDGRHLFYSVDYARMNALVGYLTENCCAEDQQTGAGCGEVPVCATS